jgi:hypothetical protein
MTERHNMDLDVRMIFQWILNKRALVHLTQYSVQWRPTCEYERLLTIKNNRVPSKGCVYRVEV